MRLLLAALLLLAQACGALAACGQEGCETPGCCGGPLQRPRCRKGLRPRLRPRRVAGGGPDPARGRCWWSYECCGPENTTLGSPFGGGPLPAAGAQTRQASVNLGSLTTREPDTQVVATPSTQRADGTPGPSFALAAKPGVPVLLASSGLSTSGSQGIPMQRPEGLLAEVDAVPGVAGSQAVVLPADSWGEETQVPPVDSEHRTRRAEAIQGCINIELFNDRAMSALSLHEGWSETLPAKLTWVLLSVPLIGLVLGIIRDIWARRLGKTPALPFETQPACTHFQMLMLGPRKLLRIFLTGGIGPGYPEVVKAVQRSLAVRSGVCQACIAEHCWDGHGWVDSPASLPVEVQCAKLKMVGGGVEQVVTKELRGANVKSLARRFLISLAATHPLVEAVRAGSTSMSSTKRVTLQLVSLMSVLATNALVLDFSGALRSWETDAECPIEQASQAYILVASLTSICINILPTALLLEVARKSQAKSLFGILFWLWTLAHLTLVTLLVLAALANLSETDQDTWLRSLEYVLSIKLVAVPIFHAVRYSVQLENALMKDKSRRKDFLAAFGLRDKREKRLHAVAVKTVETMSYQAISTEELVNFCALLGNKVMMDYDPDISTSEDVIQNAIKPMSAQTVSFETMAVGIEVQHVSGLQMPKSAAPSELSVCVLHLGTQCHMVRPCLNEQRSGSTPTKLEGTLGKCRLQFESSLNGVELNHALGFAVINGQHIIGVAHISMEELLHGRGFAGELPLHPPDSEETEVGDLQCMETFTIPAQARVVTGVVQASVRNNITKVGLSQISNMSVKVELPEGYLEALALHERWKLRGLQPEHDSEVRGEIEDAQDILKSSAFQAEHSMEVSLTATSSCGAYCEPHMLQDGCVPPDRIVTHARTGNFCHLVTSVLTDALGDEGNQNQCSYNTVRAMLVQRDFHGVLDLLRGRECHSARYWIDIFATDLIAGHSDVIGKEASHWHEELMCTLPAILRCQRQACCQQMIQDLRAKRKPQCGLPLQLLVLEKGGLQGWNGCLAEMMCARAYNVKQKLALHPDHLEGTTLTDMLQKAKASGYGSTTSWSRPYLDDWEAVVQTLTELVVDGVRKQKGSVPALWRQLILTDIYSSIWAVQARTTRRVAVGAARRAIDMAGN